MSEPQALARIDPQALLAKAVETGAGIETLERLVTLTKEIRAWTAREAWYEAMAEFQKRCPPIRKSKTAKIATRTGGSYSYSYAPLDEILSTIQQLMGELGLSVSWRTRVEGNAIVANCWVAHKLGHHEESGDVVMPFQNDGRMNPAQVVGSASTYAKRYALLAILGMAPEDDDDAQGTAGRSHGEAAPGADERTPMRTRTGVFTQAEQGNSSRARREEGLGSDKVEAEITVPVDPDAFREQSVVLFPEPDQQQLVTECGEIIKHALINKLISQKDVRAMKKTYLHDENADPSKCDVAALSDLRTYLKTRFER